MVHITANVFMPPALSPLPSRFAYRPLHDRLLASGYYLRRDQRESLVAAAEYSFDGAVGVTFDACRELACRISLLSRRPRLSIRTR